MRLRITVLALAVAALGAAPALGQGTDFSGTWQLDRDASDIPERGGPGGGRRGGGRRGGGGMDGGPAATLVITQSADLLTIEQETPRGSASIGYRLDGGESASRAGRGELVTTSSWDGPVLLTVGTMQLSTPRGDFSLDLIEQRSLSADGRTLTVESMRTLPFGEVSMRLVYRKDDGQ